MEAIYIVANAVTIAIVGAIMTYFDKRNAQRGKSRDEFNLLMLQGLESIGELAILSATQLKGQDINGKMDKAIKSYEDYSGEVTRFKQKMVKEAIRV